MALPVGRLFELVGGRGGVGQNPESKRHAHGLQAETFPPVGISTHRMNYFVTNEVEPHETAAAEQERSGRCTIEQFHHECK